MMLEERKEREQERRDRIAREDKEKLERQQERRDCLAKEEQDRQERREQNERINQLFLLLLNRNSKK